MKQKEINLDYEVFDTLDDGRTYNKIVVTLKERPLTFNDLMRITGLNRTSVFYHKLQSIR